MIRQEKETRTFKLEGRVKLSLFADDTILCIESPKDSTRKLLKLSHELSKVVGYKIKRKKSALFAYSCNGKLENKIKKKFNL